MLRHYYAQLERTAQLKRSVHHDDWLSPEEPLSCGQRALLERLTVGNSAKIHNGGELFFVIVVAVDGDRVAGRVDNVLVFERPYDYGNWVEFSRQHVWFVRDAAGQAELLAAPKQQEAVCPGSLVHHAHNNIQFVPSRGYRDNKS